MLKRLARIAFLSWNRGDFALVPILDDPGVETRITAGSRLPVGLDDVLLRPRWSLPGDGGLERGVATWDAKIDEIIEKGATRS